MNRLAKWMMRLYPARWRRRYGDELDALLAETGADARVVADLLKGGVRMQFSTWSFAKLAVLLGITGVLLGAAGSFLIAPIYESHEVLELTSQSAEPAAAELNSVIRLAEPEILSRSSLAGVINAPQLDLYVPERKVTPLEDVIETMRNDIHIDLIDRPGSQGNSAAFQIGFHYPDPAKARGVTTTLAQNFVDETFQQRLPEVAGKHYLSVVDPASLPVRPVFPNEDVVLFIGCLLGASIPFAWCKLRKKRIATWGFPVLVVAFGLMGLIATNLFYVLDSFNFEWRLLHERFRSTATMFVQNGSAETMHAIANDATSRTTLSTIINDPRLDLYKEQRKTQPLEDVIENMKRNLAITPSGQYFNISFEYRDRYKTQETIDSLMNRIDAMYKSTYRGLPDQPVQAAPIVLRVIAEASMPALPISPNRYVIAVKGGLAGLLAAAVIATIRRRWKPEGEIPVDAVNG